MSANDLDEKNLKKSRGGFFEEVKRFVVKIIGGG
jgi:hypothetical protein